MKFQARAVRLAVAAIPACILVLLFALAPASFAQLRSATITGSVSDPTGAIIPGADILVTEPATGVSYPSKSNDAGVYTVPYLEAGDYTITITKAGFEKFTVTHLHLDSAQSVRQDVKLTIGAETVEVVVNALTQHIDVEDGTLSGLTPAAVIDVIPNVTNNPFLYVELQNGIIGNPSTTSFSIGTGGRSAMTSFSVNGAQSQENQVMIDGLPVVAGGNNDAAIIPNLEGIQSVQVLTDAYSSEYGRGAGQFSITSKSGTNKFHGVADYEIRNEALIANLAQNKVLISEVPVSSTCPAGKCATSATRRQAFKVQNIGGEVDGPIIKDKLFFTSSFHYLKHNFGSSSLGSVPTALERTGDFGSSNVSGINGLPVPLQMFNPFGIVTTINSNLYQRPEFPTSTNCTSNPFSGAAVGCGDVITNPSPIGLAILAAYPLPNQSPNNAFDGNNFSTAIANTTSQYLLNNRGDWKSGRHSVYLTAGLQWDTINQPNFFGSGNKANFNDVGLITADRNYYAQVGDTVVFTPTLIMDVRYGAVRDRDEAQGGRTSGFTQYGPFGINAATQTLMADQGAAPNVTPGTWSNLTPDGQFDNKQEYQILHSGNGSVTKIKGNLTFKAGAQFQIILHNYTDLEEAAVNLGGCCANDQSQASYTGEYITATGGLFNNSGAQSNLSAATEGTAGAQTLVNEGVWFVRPGANLKPAYASKYFGFYSQNDWKVTHSLTLNLGVRYEIQPGITERYNRLAGYDFNAPNPLGASLGFPNLKGAVDFPGTMGYGRGLWDTMWNNWTPHLGFAYRLRSNLVARGGFSTTYLPTNTGNFSSPNDYGEATWASGNTGSQTYGASPHGVPTEVITDAAPVIAATKANVLAPQTYGVAEAYFDRKFKNGVQNQYNFTLETSFGAKGQWLFSAGEVGTRQNHLFTRNLPFQNLQTISASAPGQLAAWRATRNANTNGSPDPAQVQTTNPYQPTSGPLLPFQNTLAGATLPAFVPFLQFPLLQGGGENGTHGYGSFDSLQVHFAHRSTALYLDANYTWSKTLGFVQSIVAGGNISSGLDLLCNRCNRNYMSQDTPDRFIVTAIYQSPFSQGQRWEGSNAVARGVLGGWSLSPIFLFQDGTPITLSGLSGQFTGRVNYAGTGKGSVPLFLPASYQHVYNGTTKVTLPCGIIVTPAINAKLKFNACAFSGPTVTNTVNGTASTFADQYWYPNGNQTNGNIRGHSRVDVQLSLRRTFKLTERFKLDITAAATNLMNSAEWSSSPSGSIGGTDVVNNPSNGQILGLPQGGGYGGWNLVGSSTSPSTFAPREIEMVGRIVF